MTNEAAADILRELDFERLAGTAGEERARDILVGRLRALGLKPELEPFEVTGFAPGSARVEAGGTSFLLVPHGLVSDGDIGGELVFLENPEVLAFNTGACRGKILLVVGPSSRTQDLAWEGGVAALIDVAGPHREISSASHRQKRVADGKAVPSFTISYDDAESLALHAGSRARVQVRQEVAKTTAWNIVTTLGTPRRDENLLYLTAHYDSVARSRGAVDNAAGVAAALACAERFAERPPERELRLVLFSAEELGLRGSFAHVKARADELRARGRLVLNLDLGGDPIGVDSVIVVGTRDLLGYAAGLLRENGMAFRDALDTYSSDCMPFAALEIPSINLARTDGRGCHFVHTPGDVTANITAAGVAHTSRAATVLLERMLGAEIFPVRREIDGSLREKIEKYLWNQTLEKPELSWTEAYRK